MGTQSTADLRDDDGDPDASAIVAEFWHRDGPYSAGSVAAAHSTSGHLGHTS